MTKEVNYLIIGGGVAGTTAAEYLRKENTNASIAIISDEPYRLYSRLMISKPNFVLGKIPFDSIWLKKEDWYRENNIELISGKVAHKLDTQNFIVTLDDGQQIRFQKLLLATGGSARPWGVPGSEKKGVTYLRNLDEAKTLYAALKTAKKAIAIGSGFISFEICETLRMAGIDTTLIMREPYYWYPMFDESTGKLVETAMEKKGVRILRNAEVDRLEGGERIERAILKDGQIIECDLVVVGIGLDFRHDWLKEAGIDVNRGVITNEYLETNIPDIFTAGDVAEFYDVIFGERVQLGNWVNAQSQGRAAAANMLGQKKLFHLVSFYTAQAFGVTISFVGDVCVKPDRQIVIRMIPNSTAYARMVIKDGEIIGATLINGTAELAVISRLIEKDIKVADKLALLADGTFDLSTLFPRN